MIYLASPYSHSNVAIRRARYFGAMHAMAWCLKKGLHVYSPIVACHQIAIKYKLPRDNAFWAEYNAEFLKRCNELYILELPGWMESKGVDWEIDRAWELRIPTYQMVLTHSKLYELYPTVAK